MTIISEGNTELLVLPIFGEREKKKLSGLNGLLRQMVRKNSGDMFRKKEG